jgi:hypothetical protein
LEPQHRTTAPFDVPVILLNNVVEVLTLANLNALVMDAIIVLNRCLIRTAFIYVNEARFSIVPDRFGEKSQNRWA